MNVTISLCQIKPVWNSPHDNAMKIVEIMNNSESDVFVFPEMFLNGYGAALDHKENIVSESLNIISDACRDTDRAVCVGTPRFDSEHVFNSLAFLSPDGDTYYDKTHLANFGSYSEDYFDEGHKQAMGTYHGIRFGMSICYDVFFPEILHGCSLDGSSVNICAAASGTQSKRYFDTILPARALENVTYLVFVNNTGMMNGCMMHGCSRGLNPLGDTVCQCGTDENIATMLIDSDELSEARRERQHLSDYRSDIDWGV